MDLFNLRIPFIGKTLLRPKALIDSNLWIGALLKTDSTNKQAYNIIEQVSQEFAIFVTDQIIAEVLTVLRLKKHPNLKIVYERFLNNVYAERDPSKLDLPAIQPYFLKFPKLSVVDAFLLYLTWERNYLLVTLDKNLYKAAKALGLKVIGM